jgi:hypothetical protein
MLFGFECLPGYSTSVLAKKLLQGTLPLVADLERFFCVVLALATTGQSAKRRIVRLSSGCSLARLKGDNDILLGCVVAIDNATPNLPNQSP